MKDFTPPPPTAEASSSEVFRLPISHRRATRSDHLPHLSSSPCVTSSFAPQTQNKHLQTNRIKPVSTHCRPALLVTTPMSRSEGRAFIKN